MDGNVFRSRVIIIMIVQANPDYQTNIHITACQQTKQEQQSSSSSSWSDTNNDNNNRDIAIAPVSQPASCQNCTRAIAGYLAPVRALVVSTYLPPPHHLGQVAAPDIHSGNMSLQSQGKVTERTTSAVLNPSSKSMVTHTHLSNDGLD